MDRLNARQRWASWICGIGLLLALVGYGAVRFIPLTLAEEIEEQELQQKHLPRAEEMARRLPSEESRQRVLELRKQSIHARKKPPYEFPGAMLLAVGGIGLVAGLFLWFGNTPRATGSRWTHHNEDV